MEREQRGAKFFAHNSDRMSMNLCCFGSYECQFVAKLMVFILNSLLYTINIKINLHIGFDYIHIHTR